MSNFHFQILEDFIIRFADVAEPNGLVTNFASFGTYMKEATMNRYKSQFSGFTGWPDDIDVFLVFLKLLVARKRKSIPAGSILPFSLAIDKFVMHSEVRITACFFLFLSPASVSLMLPHEFDRKQCKCESQACNTSDIYCYNLIQEHFLQMRMNFLCFILFICLLLIPIFAVSIFLSLHKLVKPLQKDLDKNIYPHIVAVGPAKNDISHFYIAVENHLVDVSPMT